jgi:hypothetical protein
MGSSFIPDAKKPKFSKIFSWIGFQTEITGGKAAQNLKAIFQEIRSRD